MKTINILSTKFINPSKSTEKDRNKHTNNEVHEKLIIPHNET